MAGTRVRYCRENFVSATQAQTPPQRVGSGFVSRATATGAKVAERLVGSDKYLALFIGLQSVLFVLLLNSRSLDLGTALCLSASLLVAGLFTRQRPEPVSTDSFEASYCEPAEVTLAHVSSASDMAVQNTPVQDAFALSTPRTDLFAPILIDDQSQTWADLMARISHEIRTPLNAVIGFSDLMERELFGPLGNQRYRDYAAHIKHSGDALLRSAEDTLALSALLAAPSPGQRVQHSSLLALAQEAWKVVEPQAAWGGITMELTISDVLDVAGDRRALRQALTNLMDEAVHRSSAQSIIQIVARAEGDTVWLRVKAVSVERQRLPVAPSLSICVARALLELQGTSLVTADPAAGGSWQATTVLDRAMQQDFFVGTEPRELGRPSV